MTYVPDEDGFAAMADVVRRHVAEHYQPVLDAVADEFAGAGTAADATVVREALIERWRAVDSDGGGVELPPELADRIADGIAAGRGVVLTDDDGEPLSLWYLSGSGARRDEGNGN